MVNLDIREIQANNALFLSNSLTRKTPANPQSGTAYALGRTLPFFVPILPGWATKLRILFNLTVTMTYPTGATAVASAAAPYNIFSRIRLDYGGVDHINVGGYFMKVFQQVREHDGASPRFGGHEVEPYSAVIFTTPGVVAGDNVWRGWIDVRLQADGNSCVGMLPMGASASPIVLTLDCTPAFIGGDAFLNPVVITAGAPTAAISGTVEVIVDYKFGQSPHTPGIKVPTPVIGSFLKAIQQETAITSTANFTTVELREPYEHLYVHQVVVVPSASANFSLAGTMPTGAGGIRGARFQLDPITSIQDYSHEGGRIWSLYADQREKYGQDLDQGVIVWDFVSGTDPKHPDSANSVHIGMYNAAQAQIHYEGPLAVASNRIVTCSQFLAPVPF